MKFKPAILLLLGLFFSGKVCLAQVQLARSVDGEGGFHLKEVQAILNSGQDTLTVVAVLPVRLRAEAYKSLDLKENDQILMFNAKRVKTVQEFEKLYDALSVGEEIKLGIMRNGNLQLVTFAKADPADLPQSPRIRIHVERDDGPSTITENDNERPLFGTGLILGEKDDAVEVAKVLRGMTDALGDADVRVGDRITKINDQDIKNLKQLFEIYRELEAGTKIHLMTERDAKKMTVTFIKPDIVKREIIRN